MKSGRIRAFFSLFIATLSVTLGVMFVFVPPSWSKIGQGGGSGEIPTPLLEFANRAVELADSERYLLIGKAVFLKDMPYLEVDLFRQPWLANAKRKAFPYYPIDVATFYWKGIENMRIEIFVEARGSIQPMKNGRLAHVIRLSPLSAPSVIK